MVETPILTFRKQVWDQSIAHVTGKGPENPARLDGSPGRKGEPFERDHRIPPPIGEPVIASDDRADFIALRPRASSIGNASDRSNDEAVRCKDEFCGEPALRRCRRHCDEAAAALAFEGQRV